MMDERIRFIGGRGLMDYEKKFLREKLGMSVMRLFLAFVKYFVMTLQ